ncbi:MAG: PASTA domain-containing protein [Oscillospiraceae bacterium]|jgi:serine/threonine-protein kinase|nr:PASTA domain-containing protein [Oscillospiraceae bacterium]
MFHSENLCMNCLYPLEGSSACPHCGFPQDFVQEPPGLPLRTLLGGRYTVGKALEFGGDGISYTGWDTVTGHAVRLREFFPDAIAHRAKQRLEEDVRHTNIPGKPFLGKTAPVITGRDEGGFSIVPLDGFGLAFTACLDSFRAMWSKLEQMRGLSGLLPVLNVFEENNTVYAVQEACKGSTLREFLLLRSVTGTLSADAALRLLAPLLPALAALHSAGVLHLGISPASIIVTPERKICLTGFSVWQARTAGGGLRSELYPGYAAPEQYGLSERQGPWTDVYAVAGLYYRVLVGSDPIDATLRVRNDRMMIPGKLAEHLPAYVINALSNALDVNPHARTDSIERFRAEINAAPDAVWADTVPAVSHVKQDEELPKENAMPVTTANHETKRIIFKTAAITLSICMIAGLILSLIFKDAVMQIFSPPSPTEPQMPVITEPGPGNYEVPDFVALDLSYSDVLSNAVWSQQFKFETVFDYSSDIEKNKILEQSVAAGEYVLLGTPIVLKVSKGPEMITVPAYVGRNIADLQTTLEQAGFKISLILEPNDGNNTAGDIIWGTLTEGRQYPRGTELFLHVYDEPETTTEPETDPPETTTKSSNQFPWWPF